MGLALHARAHHGAITSSVQVLERSYAATAVATRLLARPPPYSEDFLGGVEDNNSVEGDEDKEAVADSDDDDDDDDDDARRPSARSPPYARPSSPYVSCGASPALTTALSVASSRSVAGALTTALSVAGAEAAAKDATEAAEAATQAAREVAALAAFLRADATLGGRGAVTSTCMRADAALSGGGRNGSRVVQSPGRDGSGGEGGEGGGGGGGGGVPAGGGFSFGEPPSWLIMAAAKGCRSLEDISKVSSLEQHGGPIDALGTDGTLLAEYVEWPLMDFEYPLHATDGLE